MAKFNFPLGFKVVGVYDVLLGLIFILFYENIYRALDITLPNHPGYIFVPSLFVICGGIGEFLIARNPLGNIDMVIVRLLMKLTFASAVLYFYFTIGIPEIFVAISAMSVIGVIKNVAFLNYAKSQPST